MVVSMRFKSRLFEGIGTSAREGGDVLGTLSALEANGSRERVGAPLGAWWKFFAS